MENITNNMNEKENNAMTIAEKTQMNIANIKTALADYGRYTDEEVLCDVSQSFIETVAVDNAMAKEELRNMFRKSPVWNEELDALVINGNRTHDPDYDRISNLAYEILYPAFHMMEGEYPFDHHKYNSGDLWNAICFFSNPDPGDHQRELYLNSLNKLAPDAYHEGRKPSRIFMGLCRALGVANDTAGSHFQRLFAQFADELSTRKIDFKLFVSVNPAHFITMSNPKRDSRGTMLTSCHSFNSTEYSYNNGCTGYARDPYTFIVFTASDPNDPETLNNRKTTRQIFAYKPGNGVLLQSRLYNTSGGTRGAQSESKVYRDLIQREISFCEGAVNLWKTELYLEQERVHFDEHRDFGGYADWIYEDFNAKVSIRTDQPDPHGFTIGESGVCCKCGCYTSDGVYCDDCERGGVECYECGSCYREDDMYYVYDTYGDRVQVCEHCRDRYYRYCENCDEYHHGDNVTWVEAVSSYICESCLEDNFHSCDNCGEYHRTDDMTEVIGRYGYWVYVCEDCLDEYTTCDDCGEYVHPDHVVTAYNESGEEIHICPSCRDNYTRCPDCGELVRRIENGVCPNCGAVRNEEVA